MRQHDQYLTRIDGSGRVSLRNRKFLRKFTPYNQGLRSSPPPNIPKTQLNNTEVRNDVVPKDTEVEEKINSPGDITNQLPPLTPYTPFTQPAVLRPKNQDCRSDQDTPHVTSDIPQANVQHSSPKRNVSQRAHRLFQDSDRGVSQVDNPESSMSREQPTPKQDLRRSKRAHKQCERYQAN